MAIPGINIDSLTQISNQDEVQRMADYLRLYQRKAILSSQNIYLTLNPNKDCYYFYQMDEEKEKILNSVTLDRINIVGLNRSISGKVQTFYFTPTGTPVFGCSITLQDNWNNWAIIISVGSGKIRVERK